METNYRQEVCLRRKRYWCLKCFLNAYVWIWGGRIKILSLWGNLPIHMVNAGLTPVAECLWTDTHFSVLLFYLTCGFDLHSTVAVILSAVYSTVIYKPGEIILVWGNWKLNKCCRGKAKHLLCWLPWNRLNKGKKKKKANTSLPLPTKKQPTKPKKSQQTESQNGHSSPYHIIYVSNQKWNSFAAHRVKCRCSHLLGIVRFPGVWPGVSVVWQGEGDPGLPFVSTHFLYGYYGISKLSSGKACSVPAAVSCSLWFAGSASVEHGLSCEQMWQPQWHLGSALCLVAAKIKTPVSLLKYVLLV